MCYLLNYHNETTGESEVFGPFWNKQEAQLTALELEADINREDWYWFTLSRKSAVDASNTLVTFVAARW